MPRILMSVYRVGKRKFFYCQWKDPVTGNKNTRSTKAVQRREAERFAARLAADLEEGALIDPDKVLWSVFRAKYEAESLASKALKTRLKSLATLRKIEEIINPRLLVAIDARQITRLATELRSRGLEEFTVKGHIAEVRKLLKWANRQGMLITVPKYDMPTPHGMKGRPITVEEFERMLTVLPAVVGEDGVASWDRLLRGLWLCGLRLGEALRICWSDNSDDLWVDLSGRRPLLRFRAHAHKARTEAVVPIAQDFGEFLLAVRRKARRGRLFNPRSLRPPFDVPLSAEWVSRVITRIGKKAGVKVGSRPPKKGKSEHRIKWASAHDLRRAFGFRWAMKVMPAVLQQMMRHESIQTTMEFYVGRQAEAAADALWSQPAANSLANSDHLEESADSA